MVWSVFQKIDWAIFFEETVTGQTYLKLMIMCLNDLFENTNEIFFKQYGAPPQFHANVGNFFDCTFNQRWIGRRGSSTEFTPRSPDSTSLDSYRWGTLKDTVYARKSQTQEEMRDKPKHAIKEIPLAKIQAVCRFFDVVVRSVL